MKPIRNIFIILLVFFVAAGNVFAIEEDINPVFNLTNIAETIIQSGEGESRADELKNQKAQLSVFLDANQKFNQGNASVAYDEYSKLTENIQNDFMLLNLSETLCQIGFFSLADNALERMKHKKELEVQINNLKKSYSAYTKHTKEEEIYLAKAYSSIYYDNSAQEVAFELNKKKELLEKSDYANFILAQAQIQMKQYKQAITSLNRAIEKNKDNTFYLYNKTNAMLLDRNYKGALFFISKLEKTDKITVNFKNDFLIQKKYIMQNLTKKDADKKIYSAEIAYIKGDYFKAKNICEEVIGSDKQNYKALSLLGAIDIKINKIADAKENFEKAYKINKKYAPTLEGLGDIEFINFQYEKALSYYEQALKYDKKNVKIVNKVVLTSVFTHNDKITTKYILIAKKLDPEPFYELFEIATTIAAHTPKDKISLSEEYLKKSIVVNPLYGEAWLEFASLQIKKHNFGFAENILCAYAIDRKPGFNYYYISAVLNDAQHNKEKAINDLKSAMALNPDFEPAKELYSVIVSDL